MAKPQLVFAGAILAALLASCGSAKPKTQLAGDPSSARWRSQEAERDREAARRDAEEEAYWREVDRAAAEHAAAAAEAEAAELRAKEEAEAAAKAQADADAAEADPATKKRPRR